MDAVEFVKQVRRMDCCQMRKYCVFDDADSPEDVVAEVEEWAKEHPRKTRQSVFLEQWPNAKTGNGVLFCPKNVDTEFRCCVTVKMCNDCRREFWMQEVE